MDVGSKRVNRSELGRIRTANRLPLQARRTHVPNEDRDVAVGHLLHLMEPLVERNATVAYVGVDLLSRHAMRRELHD